MSNANGTKWLWPRTRVRIYARDGWRCKWCTAHASEGAELTVDHFLSRDAGGSNKPTNLVTACFRCNSRRRHMPALAFAGVLGNATQILERVIGALDQPLPVFVP